MAKCAQNGAREEIGSTGCIEALVRLLSYDDSEVVAGNSALCLAECCRDTSVCRFLVGTNVVTDLLHHAKKEVSGVQVRQRGSPARPDRPPPPTPGVASPNTPSCCAGELLGGTGAAGTRRQCPPANPA